MLKKLTQTIAVLLTIVSCTVEENLDDTRSIDNNDLLLSKNIQEKTIPEFCAYRYQQFMHVYNEVVLIKVTQPISISLDADHSNPTTKVSFVKKTQPIKNFEKVLEQRRLLKKKYGVTGNCPGIKIPNTKNIQYNTKLKAYTEYWGKKAGVPAPRGGEEQDDLDSD